MDVCVFAYESWKRIRDHWHRTCSCGHAKHVINSKTWNFEMSEILCSSKEQCKQRCDWFIPIDLYDWIYSCIPRIKILPRILHIIVLTLPVAAYSCTGCKNPVVRITYHYSFSRPCCSCAYHTAIKIAHDSLTNCSLTSVEWPIVKLAN